ncbi:Microtubule-associated protein Jupiter [Nesidiocoris tenuis]|uniref:Microtubule-associated protein Jupiter n=1 Tax=Nesidiocoris tenuis TaxID=355587 RepID=A0ABN7B941_9HEMI|nr:Microtubule-associated protein Jupiter [Nesidiocoris tenuis]
MKPPTTPSRDIFGAEFNGTPSHQRVLKPPGGGTSDIFGANGESVNVRRVKNHLASNVFLSDGPPSAPSTPSRTPVTNGDAHDGAETPATPNGNTSPVLNGNRLANGNGSGPASPTPAAAQQQRQRVPPGGFSSGLW